MKQKKQLLKVADSNKFEFPKLLNFQKGVQLRVRGQLEIIDDKTLKDEIAAHPTRQFLKPWKESIGDEEFYKTFAIFRLKDGIANTWTMETNFAPKEEIQF